MRPVEEPKVGLVIVSHSEMLASGIAELATQMAPQVDVEAVGGTPDGGLGTDYDSVCAALVSADSGAGVVVLYDLGSAKMTAEMAVESADDPARFALVDAPVVEGAVAAAVASQGGAHLRDVAAAAVGASGEAPVQAAPARPALHLVTDPLSVEIELTNDVGLHARPAALLARTVAELDADVLVRYRDSEANAASVLALMGLGAPGGESVEVIATGKDAREAVRRIEELAERGFDD
ncbi:PTS sugar transporter subunit IIA [Lentzea sp. NBRC 105346]|uniref:dihydroxyacetone kinase phosphoryl donor subunit DhaM n=1 Tax=Lentzea sp. NBRC 105346 TaxID=3032205 RepID=UPI0024A539B6|nr:dihydroxyacetone kinase phosphoryl donor subunit DhaM [Lentzea sp. NBRC 105346]GLZ30230.1 PTS sugar transporter subunit IIA [Lentzea sp. NBRC 105346]